MLISFLVKKLLFRRYCIACGEVGADSLCEDCLFSLPHINYSRVCHRCLIELEPDNVYCTNCAINHFQFKRIIAAFPYASPISRMLHKFKYQGKLELAAELGQLFYNRIISKLDPNFLPHIIIPMPLHSDKLRSRGFNQVYELLHEFKQKCPQIQLVSAKRIKPTLPMATLNKVKRLENIRGAFKINEDLTAKNVVIIDDVVTTGATVNELTRECYRSNALSVEVWCFMRANYY